MSDRTGGKMFVTYDVTFRNYHDEGGIAVVAENEERAKELALLENRDKDGEPRYGSVVTVDFSKSVVYELSADYPERVFLFPDAGCC